MKTLADGNPAGRRVEGPASRQTPAVGKTWRKQNGGREGYGEAYQDFSGISKDMWTYYDFTECLQVS